MKQLTDIINEKLRISSKYYKQYNYHPKTVEELRKILEKRLKDDEDADLNDIDVSEITDMCYHDSITDMWGLFYGLDPHNIDISQWDVSNVKDMEYMFYDCSNFKCDLSNWDVSNIISMERMFQGCSNFNCDLSKWDVRNVRNMIGMFCYCEHFNCDLSNWNVSKVTTMYSMFDNCDSLKNKPSWYKE